MTWIKPPRKTVTPKSYRGSMVRKLLERKNGPLVELPADDEGFMAALTSLPPPPSGEK